MKKSLMLFLLPLFWVQCHKKEPITATTVQGKILELDSEVPVPAANVHLVEITGCFLCAESKRILESTMTNSKGEYQMSFNRDISKAYEIKADIVSDHFVEGFKTRGAGNIAIGATTVVDGFLFPKAWISIKAKNINPFDEADRLYVGDLGAATGFALSGKHVDTTVVRVTSGSPLSQMGYRVLTRNGVAKVDSFKLIPKPHDTTFVEILY